MSKVILIHYGEISLKAGNRCFFEDKLVNNIKASIKPCGDFKVKKLFGRMMIEGEVRKNWHQLKNKLQKVFGIANFVLAERCCFVCHSESEQQRGRKISSVLVVIRKVLFQILKNKKFKSFRITSRRAQKDFCLTSQELNEKLGAFVQEKTNARVDLENPDIIFYVEIVNQDAFLYVGYNPLSLSGLTRQSGFGPDPRVKPEDDTGVIQGPGGLPVSSSGRAVCLISGGIDSPVAAWLMMKRGLKLDFIHCHSAPQTDQASQQKVRELVEILNQWQPCVGAIHELPLQMIPFLAFQKKVLTKTPAKYRVILYRREMLRQAEKIARKIGAQALITGESLGQVASQTIENLSVIEEAVSLPVLRPLIGFDKQEIINLAKKIGTYNISIEPHQDCCSLFVPRHPVTHADLKAVKNVERLLK